MTASTATPLRSPSGEPVVMWALAGMAFCATAFEASLFEASLAPAGVMQANSAAMAKGAAMIEAEREKCDIASSTTENLALQNARAN
jgi:hypothetical protein